MALIKCTECGKEFSDKAAACPNCGCPTEYVIQAIENARKEAESKKCPFCGSEDIDADGYCNECGMKIPVEKILVFVQLLAHLLPLPAATNFSQQAVFFHDTEDGFRIVVDSRISFQPLPHPSVAVGMKAFVLLLRDFLRSTGRK